MLYSKHKSRSKNKHTFKKEKSESGDQDVKILKTIGYNYDKCRQTLEKIVIIDELSFYFMEGKGFGLFSRTRQPKFNVASCFTIMRDYLKVYVEEKERLRTTLRG